MDGFLMGLLFVGLFICIFILLSRTGTLVENTEALQKKLLLMAKELSDLRNELKRNTLPDDLLRPQQSHEQKVPEIVTPLITIIETQKEETIIPPVETTIDDKKETTPLETPAVVSYTHKADQPKPIPAPKPVAPPKPKEPGFFERNPDLEKFIGENLINKIGIAILVLGIGFFVKFAIDQNWINEIGRVFIGIVCGGILVGFAHYMRNTFRSFSSVLVGGGMAIFYLTIAIAFHEYKLMPQAIAFAIMVIITVFAVMLSILYDRKELAVLAIIGGFGSPFMVSTGSGNYQVLFTYVLILNIGMIVLSYFKRWNIINVICFIFTVLLYGGWLVDTFTLSYSEEPKPHIGALLFGTLFYLIFFAMNIINNVKENKAFLPFELTILISNTFLYYSAGMLILKGIHDGLYQGLFTILIAVFNFVFAYVLFKNKKVDNNLVYLLIGLVLTFVTLAAPIQLEGNYITLFWAAESVLLLWLSQKSGIRIMKVASFIITGLMIISLLMDWNNEYWSAPGILALFINKAFVASIMVLASLGATIFLLKKETDTKLFLDLDIALYKSGLECVVFLLAYLAGLQEVYFQFESRFVLEAGITEITPIYTGCYNILFILVFSLYAQYKNVSWLLIFPVIGCAIISFFYLIYYNEVYTDVRDAYLQNTPVLAFHYYFHYVNNLLLLLLLINIFRIVKHACDKNSKQFSFFLWFGCFMVIYMLSAELENIVLVASSKTGEELYQVTHQIYKVGFPILWGIASFALMVLGMKYKVKTLRIISLTIFGLTLLKMFIFDIREMSEGGKIAAFICLGVLLLVISFMYQKLKKILTEE
jgi:uncharacterized membrane protein